MHLGEWLIFLGLLLAGLSFFGPWLDRYLEASYRSNSVPRELTGILVYIGNVRWVMFWVGVGLIVLPFTIPVNLF